MANGGSEDDRHSRSHGKATLGPHRHRLSVRGRTGRLGLRSSPGGRFVRRHAEVDEKLGGRSDDGRVVPRGLCLIVGSVPGRKKKGGGEGGRQ